MAKFHFYSFWQILGIWRVGGRPSMPALEVLQGDLYLASIVSWFLVMFADSFISILRKMTGLAGLLQIA